MYAVIYARYSSDRQREESIEGQLEVCREYAERNGYEIVDTYIDRAKSAKTDDRPYFLRMIKDSEKKHFQAIIVYQLDRFSRNRFDSAKYKTILKRNGVTVYSANENIADNASGILLESVIEGVSEYYSAELAEKVNRGMNVNAEKCFSNGGTTPLGYKIENHKYVIDERMAPIVKEIFAKYADGMTIKDICADLNERNIKKPNGSPFNKNSFNAMLKNRKYLGIYIFKDKEIQGGMPQIIDEDLFNKVAERMKANKLAPARTRAKAEYLLTGKLFCGYCKEMMVGHSSNKTSKNGIIYNYYKCKNSGGGKACNKKMAGKDYIEGVVIDECRKILTQKNIKKISKEISKISKSYDDNAELKRLTACIKAKEDEKENQMKSLRICSIDSVRDMIFEDLEVLASEIKNLKSQLAKEQMRHNVITPEQVETFLKKLAKGDITNITYRRTLVKVLVNKIYLYDDKVTITFNSGDEEVTITDKLLSEIEKGLKDDSVCLLNHEVYQHFGKPKGLPFFYLKFFKNYHNSPTIFNIMRVICNKVFWRCDDGQRRTKVVCIKCDDNFGCTGGGQGTRNVLQNGYNKYRRFRRCGKRFLFGRFVFCIGRDCKKCFKYGGGKVHACRAVSVDFLCVRVERVPRLFFGYEQNADYERFADCRAAF